MSASAYYNNFFSPIIFFNNYKQGKKLSTIKKNLQLKINICDFTEKFR